MVMMMTGIVNRMSLRILVNMKSKGIADCDDDDDDDDRENDQDKFEDFGNYEV